MSLALLHIILLDSNSFDYGQTFI